jgi:hypothetical protein
MASRRGSNYSLGLWPKAIITAHDSLKAIAFARQYPISGHKKR